MLQGDDPGTDLLAGKRILIAEDEFLLALALEEELRSAGCLIVGPATDLDSALQAARGEDFDLALLDINLNGRMAYPVADALLRRNIPFLFLTGYGASSLPERFRRFPRCSKPCDPTVLKREIRRLLRQRR
jgi:DNA-binding response OmpR family regulator